MPMIVTVFAPSPVCVNPFNLTAPDPCLQCAPGWAPDRTFLRVAHCNMPEYFSLGVDIVTLTFSCIAFIIASVWAWKDMQIIKRPYKVRAAVRLTWLQTAICIAQYSTHIGCNGPCPLFWFFYFITTSLVVAINAILSEIFFEICAKDLSHRGEFRTTRIRKTLNITSWVCDTSLFFIIFVISCIYESDPIVTNLVIAICFACMGVFAFISIAIYWGI
jgi:hypothetical protein